jgi:hypothetical protein
MEQGVIREIEAPLQITQLPITPVLSTLFSPHSTCPPPSSIATANGNEFSSGEIRACDRTLKVLTEGRGDSKDVSALRGCG